MFNDEFEYFPEPRPNMRFEKPMLGPGRGPPGHHMRGGPPGMRRRMGPPLGHEGGPSNFRGPREPMFDHPHEFPPHGMPRGPMHPMGMGNQRPHRPQGFGGGSGMSNFGSPGRHPQPGKGPFHRPGMLHPPPFGARPPLGFSPKNNPVHAQNNHVNHGHGGPSELSGLDLSVELWVETKTAEGKPYFYNAVTRESAWTKPTENVKILHQEQIEAMAAAAGNVPVTENKEDASSNSGSQNDSSKKNNSELVNIPNLSQFPFMPLCPIPGMPMLPTPLPFGMPPPPFGMPPPGAFPPFGLPPGFAGIPTINPVASLVTTATVATDGSEIKTDDSEKENVTEEIKNKADEWSQHVAATGQIYFYNKVTAQSTWEKPQAMIDAEKIFDSKSLVSEMKEEVSDGLSNSIPSAMEVDGQEVKQAQENEINEQVQMGENGSIEAVPIADSSNITEEDTAKAINEHLLIVSEEQQKQVDKSRPISSTPIPGTPWCVVWTGDNRVFYFNPSSRASVWEKPDVLKGRPDVDKLISTSPTSDLKAERSENDSGPDAKKAKLSEESGGIDKQAKSNQADTAAQKNCITPGKKSAIEAELKASKERDEIPLEIRMKQFRDMLVEKDVSCFSTWEKELHKIVFDVRYLLLTSKERKLVFERYVKERAEEERNEKRKKMRERKDDYRKLLEGASLSLKSTFSDFAQRYGKDERFKTIEKMRERESMFNDYLQDLRKKERDERSNQKEKVKKEFMELLKGQKGIDKHSRWSEIKKNISDDSRYKNIESSSLREECFKDFVSKLARESDEVNKEREKQERVEASIREREKEVQRTLSTHLRERDKERELHKHDEAVQHFKALLTDLVRSADVSWHDAKKTLRKDHRWQMIGCLERDERERVFDEHITHLNRKKKEKFRELLDETANITLTSSWKEVKKIVRDDPRCSKFSSSDRRCEKEFKEYIKDKMVSAKADFREFLKETKIITYKSKKLIEETDHLQDIEKILQNDKRYLVLQCIADERKELLMSYIDTLDRKGPPPPPTASEPSRRSAK